MDTLDIILEGAMAAGEVAMLEAKEVSNVSAAKAAKAQDEFKAGLENQVKNLSSKLQGIAKTNEQRAIADKTIASIKGVSRKAQAAFNKSIKETKEKYKFNKGTAVAESNKDAKKRNAAFRKKIEDMVGASKPQQTETIKEMAKIYQEGVAKIDALTQDKNSAEYKKALKEAKDTGSKLEVKSGVTEKVTKTLETAKGKVVTVYEQFKDELENPSYKGLGIAVAAGVAFYGVLYGALKGFKVEGLGSFVSIVSNVKLAVKIAANPGTYGAGKSILIGSLLTVIVGIMGIVGNDVVKLVKAKLSNGSK